MHLKSFISFSMLFVVLAGCGDNNIKNGGDTASSTTATESTTTTESTAQPAAAGEHAPTANIHVVVTGGERAGTYDAVARTPCCSYAVAGDKIFGNQYSETGKKPEELSSVQLVVNDVTGNKSTDEFMMSVSFGDMLKPETYKTYTIDTQKGNKDGSGNLDLQYANNKGTVHIKGKTKDGVGLDVTLDCMKVYTAQMIVDEATQNQ